MKPSMKRYAAPLLAAAILSVLPFAAFAEDVSDTQIAVVNNPVGTYDVITVTGVSPKAKVRVYAADTGGSPLTTATASSAGAATLRVKQLGAGDGSVWVTSTEAEGTESETRTQKAYAAEVKSDALTADQTTATNNAAGTSDTIVVSGLAAGTKVRAYRDAVSASPISSATAGESGTVTLKVRQLGATAGSVYLTQTNKGKTESDRADIAYLEEPTSDPLTGGAIAMQNFGAGTYDTITVTGLAAGDRVKAYRTIDDTAALGYATANAEGTAVIRVKQLGSEAGDVYVSRTAKAKLESTRIAASYPAEVKSEAPGANDITVANNTNAYDIITVSGLTAGDRISVYATEDAEKPLVSGVAKADTLTLRCKQVGGEAGYLYVARKIGTNAESTRIECWYEEERQSEAPLVENIEITINGGSVYDKIVVSDLMPGDRIRVYQDAEGSSFLRASVAVKAGGDTATASLSLPDSQGGTVYLSVVSKNLRESDLVAVSYDAEPKSDGLLADQVQIENNANALDKITVSGLAKGERVKIYATEDATKALSITNAASQITGKAVASVSQLGMTGGTVYLSLSSPGKAESDRIPCEFDAEDDSNAPDAEYITVTNNAGLSDTVEVTELTLGDKVTVYSETGKVLGSSTAKSGLSGASAIALVKISQLGAEEGAVFVSVTQRNRLESIQVEVYYDAEQTSAPLAPSMVSWEATATGYTVTITGLSANDQVSAFATDDAEKAVSTAKAKADSDGAYIATLKLKTAALPDGELYLALSSYGRGISETIAIALQ